MLGMPCPVSLGQSELLLDYGRVEQVHTSVALLVVLSHSFFNVKHFLRRSSQLEFDRCDFRLAPLDAGVAAPLSRFLFSYSVQGQ